MPLLPWLYGWLLLSVMEVCADMSANASSALPRRPRRVASIPAYGGTATYPLDQECNGLDGTCAMAACKTRSTAPTCEFTAKAWDPAKEMSKYKCQTCTQATDPRCTTSFLTSALVSTGGVQAAYCNDKNLVIHTSGAPSHATDLDKIVIPPGGTVNGVACVTRTWSKQWKRFNIPVKGKYTLLDTATRNNNANIAAFPGGAGDAGYLSHASNGVYGLPQRGAVGVTVSGEEIYPVFSDQVVLTPESCEVDSCNEHVGQGGGAPHLHGDPFSKASGKCLYGPSNYSSLDAHPPLIGFSLDGPSIYGRYLSTKAPGYGTLDDCGGHTDTAVTDYHYHAAVKSGSTTSKNKAKVATGTEFPAFPLGPDQCWKADISKIVGFWGQKQPDEYTKPCCGMTEYYVNGVTIDGAGTQNGGSSGGSSGSSSGSSSGATSSGGSGASTSSALINRASCFSLVSPIVIIMSLRLVISS